MCNKPEDLNLNGVDIIAIDLETYDPNLKSKGTGAIRQDGFITGVAVCTKNETVYFPLQHSDTQKTEEEKKDFWDKFLEKVLLNKKLPRCFITQCMMSVGLELLLVK